MRVLSRFYGILRRYNDIYVLIYFFLQENVLRPKQVSSKNVELPSLRSSFSNILDNIVGTDDIFFPKPTETIAGSENSVSTNLNANSHRILSTCKPQNGTKLSVENNRGILKSKSENMPPVEQEVVEVRVFRNFLINEWENTTP